MNIAIDIDDTLTNSFAYFLPYVAEFFGADPAQLDRDNISYSNLPPQWKPREIEFCKSCYDRTAADTPFKPGAAEAVRTLRQLGHRIVIITGRTGEFYTDPYETTRQELHNGGIEYDRLICTLDKGRACREEQIDVLIDDLPANCAAAAEMGVRPILFTSRANRDIPTDLPRAESWPQVLALLSEQ